MLERDKRGYCCIGLDNPKNSVNVGGVLRAAGVFGANMVALSGRRYRRAPTDTTKSIRHIPVLQVDDLHAVIPFGCVPVAVELVEGALPLTSYKHPERAFYVFGAEDATLGKRVLEWCRDVVYIPSHGCLNLAACVNVVLYDRMSKRTAVPECDAVSGLRDDRDYFGKFAGSLFDFYGTSDRLLQWEI